MNIKRLSEVPYGWFGKLSKDSSKSKTLLESEEGIFYCRNKLYGDL